jgi:hypothetical protein
LAGLEEVAKEIGPLEVIVARGRGASLQRNLAARAARAPILYFLDDDSCAQADTLSRGLALLESRQAAAVGGPAVTWSRGSFWERCFGEVFSSPWGTLHIRARSTPVGGLRSVNGEELILCNLMIRKSWYVRVRGLDEQLHPGEETDLLRRLSDQGASLYYDPAMVVARGRRRHVPAFWLQHFRYGRGRGCQFGRAFRGRDLIFLVPSLFTLYLLSLALASHPPWMRIPLYLYLACSAVAGLVIGRRRGAALGLTCAALFPVLHTAYGTGFLAGWMGFRRPTSSGAIALETRLYGH